jgi:hypothetical protein
MTKPWEIEITSGSDGNRKGGQFVMVEVERYIKAHR